jgi:hypothetical protein
MAPMKNETVLFNPANNKFCVLNTTAAMIWNLLEQPRTVQDVVQAVCERFSGAEQARVEQDVQRALDELRSIECVVTFA